MKLFILVFLFIVVTCQANQSPLRTRLIARQGDPQSDEPTLNDQIYEKIKNLVKKYKIALDSDQTLLVQEIYKTDHLRTRDPYETPPRPLANYHAYNPTMSQQYYNPTPSRFNNPALQKRNSFTDPSEPTQIQQVAQTYGAEADRKARLAQVDKEALSKISEVDKQILESTLTRAERETLLAQLEDGKLDDLLPREENRFGSMSAMSALSGAAAQFGSSAGRYIGGKLAGTLGAQLGAAAGAYLGAAAASRFVKKTPVDSDYVSADVESLNTQRKEVQNSATYGFGAVKVTNKRNG